MSAVLALESELLQVQVDQLVEKKVSDLNESDLKNQLAEAHVRTEAAEAKAAAAEAKSFKHLT